MALITGAGSGIGRELALQLAERGAALTLCDVDESELAETAALLQGKSGHVYTYIADVADRRRMFALAEEVTAELGQVDLLFNNAGVTLKPSCFDRISDEQFDWLLGINMWGVYNGIRAFLPHLRQRPEAAIVNMSSLAGLLGLMGYTPYAMSKFAVRGLSEALARCVNQSRIGRASDPQGSAEKEVPGHHRQRRQAGEIHQVAAA